LTPSVLSLYPSEQRNFEGSPFDFKELSSLLRAFYASFFLGGKTQILDEYTPWETIKANFLASEEKRGEVDLTITKKDLPHLQITSIPSPSAIPETPTHVTISRKLIM